MAVPRSMKVILRVALISFAVLAAAIGIQMSTFRDYANSCRAAHGRIDFYPGKWGLIPVYECRQPGIVKLEPLLDAARPLAVTIKGPLPDHVGIHQNDLDLKQLSYVVHSKVLGEVKRQ
ncbi:hypothetical protein H9P43_008504 [Blastocladiella emersonii ATCC 22665]|nr:hypothetical protein H9P43_008504 [Blastocladiella emersonii ATCC 22665]